jgi:hypothetical protein
MSMREISQSDHIATENFCSSTEPEKGQWCKKLTENKRLSNPQKDCSSLASVYG